MSASRRAWSIAFPAVRRLQGSMGSAASAEMESRAFASSSFHSVSQIARSDATWLSWGKGMSLLAAACAAASASLVPSASANIAKAAAPSSTMDHKGPIASVFKVIFVLGGPGSGKGTQCEKLVAEFEDVAHFSAGDLLREHVKSGSKEGNMVAEMIQNGQIVPEVTVGLLKDAMERSGKTKILIDGFPRNYSNRDVFQEVMGFDCSIVLFFDCPEAELERRLLQRNQGRSDDNVETIKKRFKVFVEQSLPVVAHYKAIHKCKTIKTDRPIDAIYSEVRSYIKEL